MGRVRRIKYALRLTFTVTVLALGAGCGSSTEPKTALASLGRVSGIFVKIGPQTGRDEAYALIFAAPASVKSLNYCSATSAGDCLAQDTKAATYLTKRGETAFFMTPSAVALVDGYTITIEGQDDAGTKTRQMLRFSSTVGDTTPHGQGDYDWRKELQFTAVPAVAWTEKNVGSAYFNDVMSHTSDRFLSEESPTNAHESMHGLLNQRNNLTREKDQFFYDENGQGAYVVEPQMDARKIKEYLPEAAKKLASSRYNLYLVKQVSAYFPNVLYQFDEWNAYVTGARVGIEMSTSGNWQSGGQDIVDGAMDFLYFGSAATLALQKNEPDYLSSNKQYKAAFAMLAEKTMQYVNQGLEIDAFKGFHARAMRDHFVSSPENEPIRQVLRQVYGAAWTKRVFGF